MSGNSGSPRVTHEFIMMTLPADLLQQIPRGLSVTRAVAGVMRRHEIELTGQLSLQLEERFEGLSIRDVLAAPCRAERPRPDALDG